MDGGALVGSSPWGPQESDTTEWLHFPFSLSFIGEGNGNPLQCSCLENPRDGGAWWAAICGVSQSRTRLKRLSSSSGCFYCNNQVNGLAWPAGPSLPISLVPTPKYCMTKRLIKYFSETFLVLLLSRPVMSQKAFFEMRDALRQNSSWSLKHSAAHLNLSLAL